MIGSDEEGTYIFSLINRNTLDYCYSETGASALVRVRKIDASGHAGDLGHCCAE
jgi:hypothetical protein